MTKAYKLRYLPLFEEDLTSTVDYIVHHLHSPQSAARLVDEVEQAIEKRLLDPLAPQVYESTRERAQQYYPIYVKNFIIFYVIVDDVMEVRRFIYKKRNIKRLL